MPVRKLKPVTPSQRFRIVNGFDSITTDKPEKSLLTPKKRTGGRNNHGKMTSKYRGGGHKKRYRLIDFKRDKFDVTAEVKSIEYDPNRTAFISLLEYKDGEKRYIIAQNGLNVGQTVLSGESATPEIGNAMPINNLRVVDPVNQNLRSKEYVQKQNLREIYSRNLAPSSNLVPRF